MSIGPTATRPDPNPNGGLLLSTVQIGAAEALALPTGLITAIFLTRTLGPADYGLLTLSASLITWLQWTLAALFSRLTVKLVAASDHPREVAAALLRSFVGTGLLMAVGVFLLAPAIGLLLKEPRLTQYMRLYSLDILLFSLAQGYRSYRIGLGQFDRRALGGAARWIVRLIAIVSFVALGYGVPGAIYGSMCASVAELIINAAGDWRVLWLPGRVARKQALLEGFPIAFSSICLRLFERVDLITLKAMGAGAAAAGAYGAAQNCTIFGSVIATAIAPQLLSRLTAANKQGDTRRARKDTKHMLMLIAACLPLMAFASYIAPWISRKIFGSEYAETGPVLAVLVWAVYGMIWAGVSQSILIAYNRSTYIAYSSLATLIVSVGLNLLLVPRYGLLGAAWATTIASAFSAVICTWPAVRIFRP